MFERLKSILLATCQPRGRTECEHGEACCRSDVGFEPHSKHIVALLSASGAIGSRPNYLEIACLHGRADLHVFLFTLYRDIVAYYDSCKRLQRVLQPSSGLDPGDYLNSSP